MNPFFFIRDGKDLIRICFSDILYVEALNRYVKIFTCKGTYTTEGALHDLEKLLPENEFCRIHKSYIISIGHISRLNSKLVFIASTQLPIGRKYGNNLSGRILVAFNARR